MRAACWPSWHSKVVGGSCRGRVREHRAGRCASLRGAGRGQAHSRAEGARGRQGRSRAEGGPPSSGWISRKREQGSYCTSVGRRSLPNSSRATCAAVQEQRRGRPAALRGQRRGPATARCQRRTLASATVAAGSLLPSLALFKERAGAHLGPLCEPAARRHRQGGFVANHTSIGGAPEGHHVTQNVAHAAPVSELSQGAIIRKHVP